MVLILAFARLRDGTVLENTSLSFSDIALIDIDVIMFE
jgi:hypothetical protein